MENPVVGGYTPEKVALRRALSLAYDQGQCEIRLIRKNQMIPASSPAPPLTFGYDPDFLTDAATYDVARAKALLDTFGYIDRDGDGWRENARRLSRSNSITPASRTRSAAPVQRVVEEEHRGDRRADEVHDGPVGRNS